MRIDCDTCPVREVRCATCVVTVLQQGTASGHDDPDLELDALERRAVGLFVSGGLILEEYAVTLRAHRVRPHALPAIG